MIFEVKTDARDRGLMSISVSGELDMATADRLLEAIRATSGMNDVAVVRVELGALSFVDACGVGTLIRGMNLVGDYGHRFEVVNARGLVRRVLVLTGVLEALTGQSFEDSSL